MLIKISKNIAINKKRIDSVTINDEGKTIIIINGKEYDSEIPFEVFLSMLEQEHELELKEKSKVTKTTNPAQYAG